MAKNKKSSSKKPKAPAVVQPPSIYTPLGNAVYSNGQYNYSADDESENNQTLDQARLGFQNMLGLINNPASAIAEQQQVYRNALVPAFNNQADDAMAKAKAGLGNKYFSTFGQLTLNNAALQQARARADLEKAIYDSGQDLYDRNVGRAGQMGGLTQVAQAIRMSPYQLLGQLTGTGNQGVQGLNTANAMNYNTAAGMYNATAQRQPQQGFIAQSLLPAAQNVASSLVPGGSLFTKMFGGTRPQ